VPQALVYLQRLRPVVPRFQDPHQVAVTALAERRGPDQRPRCSLGRAAAARSTASSWWAWTDGRPGPRRS
jgi:hypothetical protein